MSRNGATNTDICKWLANNEGRAVFDRAKGDIRTSQKREQLVLLFLAMLCYWRILPPSHTNKPVYSSHLKDFDGVLHNEKHELQVLERMVTSLSRLLSNNESAVKLLTFVGNSVDIDNCNVEQSSYDYWKRRTSEKDPGHKTAFDFRIRAPPPLRPTWYGRIESTKDAAILVEACLRGKLNHVPRNPYEAEIWNLIGSGAVFVFEEGSSGIKTWNDCSQWRSMCLDGDFNSELERGKKVPLLRKSIVMAFNGVKHYVISYYLQQDLNGIQWTTPSESDEFQGISIRDSLISVPWPLPRMKLPISRKKFRHKRMWDSGGGSLRRK